MYFFEVLFIISAIIGAAVLTLTSWVVFSEMIRAARQAGRIAAIQARSRGQRKASWAEWWFYFKHDILAQYDEKIVGPFKLHRNPNKKIKRAFDVNGDRYTD